MKFKWRLLQRRFRGLDTRTRLKAALLGTLCIAGAVWMCLPESRATSPGAVNARRGAGTSTPPNAPLSETGERGIGAFERLAGESDLWSTQYQNAQRWHAAKMSTLSELIGRFPGVVSAVVIFDPGRTRSLGAAAVAPTAAVNIVLEDGALVTSQLVSGIADLISGSIAGMDRQSVCVVDNAGRSYRAGEGAGVLSPQQDQWMLWAQRSNLALREALVHIPDVRVTAQVREINQAMVPWVTVLVPRSYLLSLFGDADSATAMAPAVLENVRQLTMQITGLDNPENVSTNWYYDVPSTRAKTRATPLWQYGLLAASFAASPLLLMWAGRLRRRRKNRPEESFEEMEQGFAPSVKKELLADYSDSPLSFLDDLESEQLIEILQDESPQIIAMVMAAVSPARAAAILASMVSDRQAQVVRRLAVANHPDPQALHEIAIGLANRVTRLLEEKGERFGELERVTEILHHAGYSTQRHILNELDGHAPELADLIRDHMFAFEDLVNLPVDTLRPGLIGLGADELAVALRTAGKKLRKKIFAAMSSADARKIRLEMERIGPVRLSDIEVARQRVVESIRQARYGRYEGSTHLVGKELTA